MKTGTRILLGESDRNVLLPSSRDEIVTAYDTLMQLRLQALIAAVRRKISYGFLGGM